MYLSLRANLVGQDLHHERSIKRYGINPADYSIDLCQDKGQQNGGKGEHKLF